ncbi:MAG: 3-dehydroquinate synthase [Lachnospiraceae bacterium]|nr:3-dehydroquinate synthase [Lachnospiraceae bacterium]
MADRLFVHTDEKDEKKGYEIILEKDFSGLEGAVKELGYEKRRMCIVTDSNVSDLYASEVERELKSIALTVTVFVFEAGEENKNLDTVRKLYTHLIENRFDRKDVLIALGGGVVGDLTGFAAATFLRGIDFIQLPTTLLSCTDSSIGGKTGVDLDSYKNMVGAFYMPRLVYMNLSALESLSARQFASGMAEVIKHGLIRDESYYEYIVNNFNEINDREVDVLKKVIKRSLEIKRDVVEKDPTEQGERALLNFGHTIGHAIEKYSDFKLTHGECVALGSIAACYISYKRQQLSTEEFYEIRDMYLPFFLPISLNDDADADEILKLTKSDKKMQGNRLKFILLKKPGKAVIDTTVTDEEILDAIKQLIITDEFD